MEEKSPSATGTTRRWKPVLLASLIASVVALAVIVPTVLLTQRDNKEDRSTTNANGEHNIFQQQDDQEDGLVDQRQRPPPEEEEETEEDVLLSDLYSSTTLSLDLEDLEEEANNATNATNTTTYSNQTDEFLEYEMTPTDAPSASSTPKPTRRPTSPTISPTNWPTPAPTNPSQEPTGVPTQPQLTTTVDSYSILEVIPHDTNAFTQGLTFDPNNNDLVYESTGLVGESDVRHVDIQTGEVLLLKETPFNIFGEGLAFYQLPNGRRRLIHITWQSQRGFIFDADTLETLQEFTFETHLNEGWGITHLPDADVFAVTDGSQYLHFWNRQDLSETNRVRVTMQLRNRDDPEDVLDLNEIEWDEATQTILANVWRTDWIVRIDPGSGRVITRYDMSNLYPNRIPSANVLNGIAINGQGDLWVTGKKWPNMYRIEFNE